ncbi:hypothetical protein [Pontimicrobium sp. MEBiC01747]
MKKQILNLGNPLNKGEQKQINGGDRKPELCNFEGFICYPPRKCHLNPDGSYSCVY